MILLLLLLKEEILLLTTYVHFFVLSAVHSCSPCLPFADSLLLCSESVWVTKLAENKFSNKTINCFPSD